MTKPIERGVARQLRAEHGFPVKEIARMLAVSPASVSHWVRDVELTAEQRHRNLVQAGRTRGNAWREKNRERRREFQEEGRRQARASDSLHLAGCMLYWAEGNKSRNRLVLTNSDANMLVFFLRFLRESLNVQDDRIAISLNVYLDNGLSLAAIEDRWLSVLRLPRSSLRKPSLNHFPTSSSGRKRSLPFGVCTVAVLSSAQLVQQIYGAIQEYTGLDQPTWLDGHYR